ncbi:MAG: aminotransferase class IV [Chitinophagaceae bacterium]
MNYICVDGKIMPGDQPVLMADNKSYRYGDGLFETMKVVRGKILLEVYHFERFFEGLKLMQFEIPALVTAEKLTQQILSVCDKSDCTELARVRLSVFRGNGGIYEGNNTLHYIIECWPAENTVNTLNENGLIIGVYPDARKSCDKFSNLKSANYLPYVMAARHAKHQKLNDCLIVNTNDRIADATIANVFLIKNDKLTTPPLSEGCVNGIMRRHLLKECSASQYEIQEKAVTQKDIEEADEIFLTNSMYGIRWVKQFENKIYTNSKTKEIYKRFVEPLRS